MANYKSIYTGAEIDSAIGKANTALQEHQKLKTINNESLVGDGNITIEGTSYEAGNNIQISEENVISATDTIYDDTELREAIAGKQEELISGTNIKTINGNSILGEGNLVIEGGGEGLSSVAHDNTMTGAGTNESPLGVDSTKFATASQGSKADSAVQNTDYASSSTGGVVKVSNGDYGLAVDEGVLKGAVKNASQYSDMSSEGLVAKGTLENVLTAKNYQNALTAGTNIRIENNVISSDSSGIAVVFAASNSTEDSKRKANYICTGTNDQVLINSVISQMTSGEVIFLQGTYNISSEINPVSNVNITGNGNPIFKLTERSISTLKQAVERGDTSIYVNEPENFLVGQKISIGGTGFTYDNTLGNIKTINNETGEITVYQRGTNTETGAVGKNNGVGATVYSEPSIFMGWSVQNSKIEGVVCDGNRANLGGYTSDTDFGSNCIQFTGSSNIKVINNTIYECYKHGILIRGNCTDCYVMNNYVSNCSTHGIDIASNTTKVIVSQNNLVSANIQCHNAQHCNIENNSLRSCTIHQQGNANYNIISGNVILPAMRGIQLSAGATNLLITGNFVYGGEYGIQIDGGSRIALVGNYFGNQIDSAIHLINTSLCNVSQNTIENANTRTADPAIKLGNATTAPATRNKISDNFIKGTTGKTTHGVGELNTNVDYNYINNNICYTCDSGAVGKLGTNTTETGNVMMQ